MAEWRIEGIERIHLDLNAGRRRSDSVLSMSPFAKVPALQRDDGRVLNQWRAICVCR